MIVITAHSPPRRIPTYRALAHAYDATVGIPFFRGLRCAFEQLVNRHRIPFRSAADLGCGTGLFARYLHDRWRVPVLAVDRSAAMLKRAARRCDTSNVRLLRQDIRCLRLPCDVDLVTANFDTVNHLLTTRDLCRALRRIAQSLRPGGHFIFDFVTNSQPLGAPHRYRIRNRLHRRVRRSIRWDPVRRLLSIAVNVSRRRGPPACGMHVERAYAPEEMTRCLLAAGFIIRGIHDARTLESAHRCSPRIVVVARKAG